MGKGKRKQQQRPAPTRDMTAVVIILLLVLITIAAFWGVLRNDFVGYDDPGYVKENFHLEHPLALDTITWAFNIGYQANWHPLTWLSHAADLQVFGLKPWGHHLTSLLLHIASVVGLFLFLSVVTGSRWRSGAVAGLFAVHPLHVESVAWVAERKDVLSTFFLMLTL